MTVKKEYLVYDGGNLFADLGGLMGILLGASMLTFYDVLVSSVKRLFKRSWTHIKLKKMNINNPNELKLWGLLKSITKNKLTQFKKTMSVNWKNYWGKRCLNQPSKAIIFSPLRGILEPPWFNFPNEPMYDVVNHQNYKIWRFSLPVEVFCPLHSYIKTVDKASLIECF